MSESQREKDMNAADACFVEIEHGGRMFGISRTRTAERFADALEAARKDGEAALARRVREAGMAAIAAHTEPDLDVDRWLRRDATLEPDPNAFWRPVYARALLAMLEALPKEPTDAET